jgi:PAS domain S-box-containing protein
MAYDSRVSGSSDRLPRLAEQLELVDEQLRALFAASTDGMMLVDREGRVERMSPAAEVMTGWPEREAQGRPLDEVVQALCEADRARWNSPAAHALANGELASSAGRVVLVARGGDERPIGATAAPVLRPDGTVAGVALVLHDHEDIRRADEAAELLGGLATSLAHEVNNPLSSVLGSLDFLSGAVVARDGQAAEMEDALRTARSGAERIRRLVHEMRAGQTGRPTVPPPPPPRVTPPNGLGALDEEGRQAARPVTTTVVRTRRIVASSGEGDKPGDARGASAPGAGPASAGGATATGARKARLLIVDDDPLVGTSLRRVLSREHDVTVELGAREALARLVAGEAFDVVLCDLMMPDMTGMELHAEIERIAPPLAERMVFLTGGAYTAHAREFLAAVSNPRLQKPFDAQLLRAVVREVLAGPAPA